MVWNYLFFSLNVMPPVTPGSRPVLLVRGYSTYHRVNAIMAQSKKNSNLKNMTHAKYGFEIVSLPVREAAITIVSISIREQFALMHLYSGTVTLCSIRHSSFIGVCHCCIHPTIYSIT